MNGDLLEYDLCHKLFPELFPLRMKKKLLAVCRKCRAMNLWNNK